MSSRSLNKAMLIGNLTRDPELRYTPQGTAVASIGLATNRQWTTDSGERREEVEFHRLVAWNKLAELCSQLLYKGAKVYIEGRLQTRSWTGNDNLAHTITEIVIDDMMVLSPRREGPVVENQSAMAAEPSEPVAVKKTKKTKEKKQEIITNLSMYGLKNRLFFVNKFSLATNTMEGIIFLEHDEKQNLTKKIVANKGVYKDGLWNFYQCITYNFDENIQIKEEPKYLEEEVMDIPETPYDFLHQMLRPDYMTISQLNNYMWRLSKSGATTVIRNLKVDLYQRFASPFTSIVIILLGIPFSMMMKKRATGMSSVGLSIMVGFLYYVLNAISIALGKAGILVPSLAASLSHIIALISAIYLIDTLP